MISVGVIGATGYTGSELLRLLLRHPNVILELVTSRGESGRRIDELFPSFIGACDLTFSDPSEVDFDRYDVIFFATPHTVAMREVPNVLASGTKVVDLSGDFRLKKVDVWENWYGQTHTAPELCLEAVYGLPEINRQAIKSARLVACPGCYPTSVILGFLPLIEADVVDRNTLIASCGSGVSGAGRQAKITSLLTEAGENLKAYSVSGHRHLPEIEQQLGEVDGMPVQLTFVPHLVPMSRGIHATLFARLTEPQIDLQRLYESRFANEPAVTLLSNNVYPETKSVRGANSCQISVEQPMDRGTVVVMSVIDNLVKGAAGQAIQAMNLMFGISEMTGLDVIALSP